MMNPCFGMLLIFAATAVLVFTAYKIFKGYRTEIFLSFVLLVATLCLSYFISTSFICPGHLPEHLSSKDFLSIFSLVFACFAMYLSTLFVFLGFKQAQKAKEEQAIREQSYADDLKKLQDAMLVMQNDITSIKDDLKVIKQSRRPFLCRLLSCLCNE